MCGPAHACFAPDTPVEQVWTGGNGGKFVPLRTPVKVPLYRTAFGRADPRAPVNTPRSPFASTRCPSWSYRPLAGTCPSYMTSSTFHLWAASSTGAVIFAILTAISQPMRFFCSPVARFARWVGNGSGASPTRLTGRTECHLRHPRAGPPPTYLRGTPDAYGKPGVRNSAP